ncbi:LAGLIDADG family homing endonuclease [Streptomyces sp. CC208A]|uniref:LAGLIDADG family homing endonuclease n=1 Tax=Streptomyces sp. CC208A TaxID=3044573 RepID=UPI0024A7AFCA|nr:LAGLIDADG family homing endonuclease [Streptomyces sp. CC208A]
MAGQDLSAPARRFMDLEDPEYAYMFDFLQADGHLSEGTRQRGCLAVEINARDAHILREFQRLTPHNSTITERTRSTNFSTEHHSATWSLCSLEARTTLNQLGLPYGKKSTRIKPPRVEFSRRDYLRGVIDADGSVGHTGQGFPFVSLTTSSAAIGAYLCHYAKKTIGAERRLARRNTRDGVYNVMYQKEAAQELCAHLYYPGCLSLDRKRLAAEALASWTRPAGMKVRPPRRPWTAEEDQVLMNAPTLAVAASELGRSQSSCQVRRWRLVNGIR